MQELPRAESVPAGEDREAISSQARRKFSGALANDTKWNELLEHIRGLQGWRPPYRCKWVNGHVSGWDAGWFYHLPFPFVGVEWFDIGLQEQVATAALKAPQIIDHSPALVSLLQRIGFDFEVRGDVARIWGYFPKSYEDFPPRAGGSIPASR